MRAAAWFLIAALTVSLTPCASFGLNSGIKTLLFRNPLEKGTWQGRRPQLCIRASIASDDNSYSRIDSLVTRKDFLSLAAAMVPAVWTSTALAATDELWSEEVGGSDGQGVSVKFTWPKTWKLDRKPGTLVVNEQAREACEVDPDCDQGDVFTRSAGGDSAFLTLATPNEDLEKIPFLFFKQQIFSRGGKFGAYGAPEDVKFLADKTANGLRLIDVKFTSLSLGGTTFFVSTTANMLCHLFKFSPGGASIGRRGLIAVSKAGPDAYMLVCTTSTNRWKTSEDTLRGVATSFSVTPTGKPAPVAAKVVGVKKSMFAAQNAEREQLERERQKEGIQ